HLQHHLRHGDGGGAANRRRRISISPSPSGSRRWRRMRGNRRLLGSSPPFSVRLGATATATRCRRPSDSSPLSPTRVPQIHEKLRREHARQSSSPARQR
ncbi:hypothetical protein LINGRAHAP2_LOCUS27966, partial [Linum grandiflorum]